MVFTALEKLQHLSVIPLNAIVDIFKFRLASSMT